MSEMHLLRQELIKAEIVHYADNKVLVTSFANKVTLKQGKNETVYRLPQHGWQKLMLPFRLARRALRLDKCNVFPLFSGSAVTALIAIRQGIVYRIDCQNGEIKETLTLRQCRNVLHRSICKSPEGHLYFGEYGRNSERKSVPVYRSVDQGQSWTVIYEFPEKSIKHIHGCFWDPYEEKVWVCTGDYKNENYIIVANEDFNSIETLGDGSQKWRTCFPFFKNEEVIWAMDSELETSYICSLQRKDRTLTKVQDLPGPVWYAKELTDGWHCIATVQEIGIGVKDKHSHILVSQDAKNWQPVHKLEADWYPKRYLKFGAIGFADGPQSSEKFYIFAEALSGWDGKSFCCKLTVTEQRPA
ncbi:MAG: hypothetical protein MPJ24_11185 [Pirellulaceae bacterium]|nr:hypothetical protein [Pirellulaceae bacterium]